MKVIIRYINDHILHKLTVDKYLIGFRMESGDRVEILIIAALIVIIIVVIFKGLGWAQDKGLKGRAKNIIKKGYSTTGNIKLVQSALGNMRGDWEAEKLYNQLEEIKLNMDKVHCPQCNAMVNKEAEYCSHCGQKLVTYTKEETRKYIEELQNSK